MKNFIKLYSDINGEIKRFLNDFFYDNKESFKNLEQHTLEFRIDYQNPVIMSEIIGALIDNKDKYKINMWICIDDDVLINVTSHNANEIIKYLYERYPY